MREQDDGPALAVTAHHPPDRSAPDRGLPGRRVDHACFDSGFREDFRKERREGFLVSWRVGGFDPNRLREQFRDAVFCAREVASVPRKITAVSRAPLKKK
jgi:hypothetical protein